MITTNLVENAVELVDTVTDPGLTLTLQYSELGHIRLNILDEANSYKVAQQITFEELFLELCNRLGIVVVKEEV